MSLSQEAKKLAGKLLTPIRVGDRKLAPVKVQAPPTPGVHLSSTSFPEWGEIPARYSGEAGISPELSWDDVPSGTKELAILCEDPDAPMPRPFVHWVLYGLSPAARELPEGMSRTVLTGGAIEGKSSAGTLGFMGPKPPPGHGVHHYHFELFALDEPAGLPPGADREALLKAMKGHVLSWGEVVGTYQVP